MQIGHTRPAPSASPGFGWAPTLILDPISWPISGRLPLTGGDIDAEPMETVLSDGGIGLEARGAADGGARPLPLPKMRPPPSFRPDMMSCAHVKKKKVEKCAGPYGNPVTSVAM